MTTQTIESTLRAFFAAAFPERTLGAHEDIFALGFGNSLFAMQLVEFVEHEFDVRIEDDDLDIDNFRSILTLAAFVTRKLELRAAG